MAESWARSYSGGGGEARDSFHYAPGGDVRRARDWVRDHSDVPYLFAHPIRTYYAKTTHTTSGIRTHPANIYQHNVRKSVPF